MSRRDLGDGGGEGGEELYDPSDGDEGADESALADDSALADVSDEVDEVDGVVGAEGAGDVDGDGCRAVISARRRADGEAGGDVI